MTQALLALTGLGGEALYAMLVVFLRVGAVMAVLPAFGEQSIPMRVRLVLAGAFTVIVAPAIVADLPTTEGDLVSQVRTLGAEVVVGLALGLGLRLFILALQTAGAMAAQAVSLSQIFGGSAGVDPQPAISHLLTIAGLALAMLADLHVRVAAILIQSYEIFAPGLYPNADAFANWGVYRTAQSFALAFSLAAPFVVASVLYNVALGVINRAMPQLMVSFVGAPALTWGGLALLLLSTPIMLDVWIEALLRFMGDPMGAGR
jgi:flagellar biosynthesis protein FliR